MDESGWIGKGSCGIEHCGGGAPGRPSWSRQDSAGFYQWKYRHCLRDDRSGSRFPGHVVQAGERFARAQAHSARYGANIIYTDPADGSDGAIRKARELYAAEPEKYFYADQYSNDA